MWKIFTHDYRSPIQGGPPVWDGSFPFELPETRLDTSQEECAAGWNFCHDIATALRIGGLWPTGRPAQIVRVEPIGQHVERGNKCRAAQLRLVRLATEDEVREGITQLSKPFGEYAEHMAASQLAWRTALARPRRDEKAIVKSLQAALDMRGLDWGITQYPTAWDAWVARAARDAWDAWAVWDAWVARDARAARAARDAWVAWVAWDARDARDAGTAWDAWDARDALTVEFSSLMGWITHPSDLLTKGLREAYASGLERAIPTGPKELGWVVCEEQDAE